jgi:hypothetical protein
MYIGPHCDTPSSQGTLQAGASISYPSGFGAEGL